MINHYSVICDMAEAGDIPGYSLLCNGEEIGLYHNRQMAIDVAKGLMEQEEKQA